jgi:hypothetical protein
MSTILASKRGGKRPTNGELAGLTSKRTKVWHTSAPAEVAGQCKPGEAGEGWDAWIDHLRRRREPPALARLLPGKPHPLLWNLPQDSSGGESAALLTDLWRLISEVKSSGSPRKKVRVPRDLDKRVAAWIAESGGEAAPSESGPLEQAIASLALAHALPRLAEVLSAPVWWNALVHLVEVAREARPGRFDNPLAPQLQGGELPWTLAYHLPEITFCRNLASDARRGVSADIVELLDGEGLPHHRDWDWFRPLLASWTRCRVMRRAGEADGSEGSCLNEAAEVQYDWAVLQSLRLARGDGRQLLSLDPRGAWNPPLFQAALREVRESGDTIAGGVWSAARRSLPANGRPKGRRPAEVDAVGPSVESEWSGAALLRTDWSSAAPRLAVRYDNEQVVLECEVGGEVLLGGAWEFDVRCEGSAVHPVDGWEQVCWESDESIDYLELRIELSEELCLERQLLLAREVRFLFLCDNLISQRGTDQPLKLDYRGAAPLGGGIAWRPERETREGLLVGRRPRAVVLPLALPEWRSDPRRGTLDLHDDRLVLRQEGSGAGLCCPLWFDLSPHRSTTQRTWRQLTVAQSLATLPPTVAAGFRVQVGSRQWLVYRSLAQAANRSVLGQNTSSEFLLARFDKSGEIEGLLEIE